MKVKYILLVIAGSALSLSACKKSNSTPVPNTDNSALVGKWNEVKLHVNQTGTNGVNSSDTTINAASFTSYDYAQFDKDYTAIMSRSAPKVAMGAVATPDYIAIGNYTYKISGSTLVLTSTTQFTMTQTITQVDATNLVLHYVYTQDDVKITTDTYFVKAQ